MNYSENGNLVTPLAFLFIYIISCALYVIFIQCLDYSPIVTTLVDCSIQGGVFACA